MELMTKEESYADRRQLFKDIWETAMHIDDKEDIMNKPKVIKTLRLSEVDKCPVGKKKKERIKNLRTVCNKILDFCDRQEADDIFYEKLANGQEPPHHKFELPAKKTKPTRKRKMKKAKSLSVPRKDVSAAKETVSERKEDIPRHANNSTRIYSPNTYKKIPLIRKSLTTFKTASRNIINMTNNVTGDKKFAASVNHRKTIIKKNRKKSKPLDAPVLLNAPNSKAL